MSDPINDPADFHRNGQSARPAEPAEVAAEPTAQLLRLGDLLGDFRRDADAAHLARTTGQPRGPVSGLAVLDRELGGALAPGLHGIHGNAGAGKTAFALQVAASCGCPALFVSCEMAPLELLRRQTARATRTYLGRLKSGELRGEDAEKLARRAIEAAPLLAFIDATRGPATPKYLLDCARIVRGQARHLLIVVDSLHSWAQGISEGLPEYEALNAGLQDLQRLAAGLACPVVVVSERNRASMAGGGLSAGAGTRKIEYSAETIIELDRKNDAKEDGAGEVEVTLKLAKNRHGVADKPVALKFDGALQSFRLA